MARWRRERGVDPCSPAAVVEGELQRAEAAGDGERAAVLRSYLAMLDAAGGDPDVAGLFAVFAGEDRPAEFRGPDA